MRGIKAYNFLSYFPSNAWFSYGSLTQKEKLEVLVLFLITKAAAVRCPGCPVQMVVTAPGLALFHSLSIKGTLERLK